MLVHKDADRGQIEFLLSCAGGHDADAKGSAPQSAKLHIKSLDFMPAVFYEMIKTRRNHGCNRAPRIGGRKGR
jgi:hypothetical protein